MSGSRRELRPPNQRDPSGGARAERRVHGAFVILETALVLVLLIGAGLLLKSFWKLLQIDPGFRRDRILTVSVSLPDRVYGTPAQKREFYDRLLERVRLIPGTGDASAVNLVPFGPLLWQGDFAVEGQPREPDLLVGKPAVSEGCFQTLGIPLLRGRAFDEREGPEAPLVAIVSEAVARRCWPGQDALGRRLTMDDPKKGWWTVVGVGDVRQQSLAAKTLPMIYVPLRQESRSFFLGSMTYLARTPEIPPRRRPRGALRSGRSIRSCRYSESRGSCALAATRVLESFLFGVTPVDLTTFLVVSLALTAAATLASAGPARCATRVDPAVALRYD